MVSFATYSVTFVGPEPEQIKVGDEIIVSGKATVQTIRADLIDITQYGINGSEYALGQINIDLYSNSFEVERA